MNTHEDLSTYHYVLKVYIENFHKYLTKFSARRIKDYKHPNRKLPKSCGYYGKVGHGCHASSNSFYLELIYAYY